MQAGGAESVCIAFKKRHSGNALSASSTDSCCCFCYCHSCWCRISFTI